MGVASTTFRAILLSCEDLPKFDFSDPKKVKEEMLELIAELRECKYDEFYIKKIATFVNEMLTFLGRDEEINPTDNPDSFKILDQAYIAINGWFLDSFDMFEEEIQKLKEMETSGGSVRGKRKEISGPEKRPIKLHEQKPKKFIIVSGD